MATITLYEDLATVGATEETVVSKSVYEKFITEDLDTLALEVNPSLTVAERDIINFKDVYGNTIFSGWVGNINLNGKKSIIVYNWKQQLYNVTIKKNFRNYKPEEIIEEIIDDHTVMTYSSTISTSNPIEIYASKDRKIINILKDMLDILPGVSFRISADKTFTLEFSGATTSTKSVNASNNAFNIGGVQSNTDNLCTRVIVKGDSNIRKTEEFFDGTGSEDTFTLANSFVNFKVEYPVGTELTPTIDGVIDGDYTFAKEEGEIVFDTPPASGTNNIKVREIKKIILGGEPGK